MGLLSVSTSLPLEGLGFESLGLPVLRKSLVSVGRMGRGSGVGVVQSLVGCLGGVGGGGILIDDLVGVDGGLDDSLGQVLLDSLCHGDHSLSVDDGLNLIDDVGVDVLLDDGLLLDDTTHVGGGGLLDVLLNVVNDVFVDFSVNNGLDLDDLVLSDGLLDDGSIDCGSLDNGDGSGLLGVNSVDGLGIQHVGLCVVGVASNYGDGSSSCNGDGTSGVVGILLVVARVENFVENSGHD